MRKFEEYINEVEKMRTKNGNEYAIPKVNYAGKVADSVGLSDSRLVSGMILDWCKFSKVKIEDVKKAIDSGKIDKKVAKTAFQVKNLRKQSTSGEKVLAALKGEVSESLITESDMTDDFVAYFNGFYGVDDAVYPKANRTGKNFTKEQLEKALKIRDKNRKFPFAGDSVDRETLGSIMIDLKLMNDRY